MNGCVKEGSSCEEWSLHQLVGQGKEQQLSANALWEGLYG